MLCTFARTVAGGAAMSMLALRDMVGVDKDMCGEGCGRALKRMKRNM